MTKTYDNEMKIEFLSKSKNEAFARIAVAAFIAQLDPTVEEVADIKTAVSEAVTNAIIHGYECQAREGAGADRRGEGRARGAAAGVCEFRARRPAKSAQQHLCDGRKGQQDQAHPVERGPQAEQVDPTFFAPAGAYAEKREDKRHGAF